METNGASNWAWKGSLTHKCSRPTSPTPIPPSNIKTPPSKTWYLYFPCPMHACAKCTDMLKLHSGNKYLQRRKFLIRGKISTKSLRCRHILNSRTICGLLFPSLHWPPSEINKYTKHVFVFQLFWPLAQIYKTFVSLKPDLCKVKISPMWNAPIFFLTFWWL